MKIFNHSVVQKSQFVTLAAIIFNANGGMTVFCVQLLLTGFNNMVARWFI